MRAARYTLLLAVVGGALALGASSQAWQTVTAARARPLADQAVAVSGRTLDGAGTALAVVALAGAVALLATRGRARRIVGGLLVLTGVALGWRSVLGLSAVAAGRARELVSAADSGVGVERVAVGVHPVWPLLSLASGLLIAGAGVLAVVTAAGWSTMSARYESPAPQTDASLWNALDRGDDPTVDSEANGS